MPEDEKNPEHDPATEAREETPAGEPVEPDVTAQADGDGAAAEPAEEEKPPEPNNKRWYVVKVQSGREESIKDAIERRVKIEGLE